MKINSPEVFLKSFNNRILELLNSTEILENSEIRRKLQLIYRKLTISEILFEKYIISISGLQGVGKSTLVKQIYSIPEDLLPENLGRGEQLPVLITESEVNEITLHVIRLKEEKGQYMTVKENLEREDFFRISKDPKPTDLILEMRVPNKIFNSEKKSFLLLPGFEDSENEREDLVYHSLISSATCLFLFNETGFANASNKNILEQINSKFESAKPIFLATFSDESKDENETLKKNLIEKFNIQNEDDRVISIGTGRYKGTDKSRIEDWLPALKQSLGKYSNTTSQFRYSQMENLRDIIEDDLGEILEIVEEVNDVKQLKSDVKALKEIEKPLEVLDAHIKKIRKKYSKTLENSLDEYALAPIDEIRKFVKDENIWGKVKRVTLGNSLSDNIKFEENIYNCWHTANGYGVQQQHAVVLNKLLSNEFKFHKNLELNPKAEPKELLGDLSQPENTDLSISDETISDIRILFMPDDSISKRFSDKFNNSLKALPLLYLEFIRIASVQPINIDLDKQDVSIEGKIEEILASTERIQPNKNLILPAISTLLGIDALDGEINTMDAVSSTLGVSSATLASSLLAIAGVIAAGALVKSTITQINKTEIEDAAMAKALIIGLRDRYYAYFIEKFNDIMEDLRDMVKAKLVERYHIDKELARWEHLQKSLADIREDKYKINQILNKQLTI